MMVILNSNNNLSFAKAFLSDNLFLHNTILDLFHKSTFRNCNVWFQKVKVCENTPNVGFNSRADAHIEIKEGKISEKYTPVSQHFCPW